MGSPFRPSDGNDDNTDERMRFAPRWARELQPAANANASPKGDGRTPRAALTATRFTDVGPTSPQPVESFVAIERLRKSLEPTPVPEPPLLQKTGPRLSGFALLGAAVIIGAGTGLGTVTLMRALRDQDSGGSSASGSQAILTQGAAPSRQNEGSLQPAVPTVAPAPRLTVEDRRGVVNQPIRFAVDLKAAAVGSFVLVSGLAPGTRLTVGAPADQGGWKIPALDIADVQVIPPRNFVGTMELPVDLRLADNTVADSNVLRLEWVVLSVPVASAPVASAPVASAPVADAVPTLPSPQGSARSSLEAGPSAYQLDREEIDAMISRGKTLLANGDIVAARLLLQRPAEAGDMRAALVLGASYDPAILRQLGVLGTAPSVAQARAWYEKASELGSTEAQQRLDGLARLAH